MFQRFKAWRRQRLIQQAMPALRSFNQSHDTARYRLWWRSVDRLWIDDDDATVASFRAMVKLGWAEWGNGRRGRPTQLGYEQLRTRL